MVDAIKPLLDCGALKSQPPDTKARGTVCRAGRPFPAGLLGGARELRNDRISLETGVVKPQMPTPGSSALSDPD